MTQPPISRDLALERIRHHIQEHQTNPVELPLFDSLGLVCGQDLFAVHATPAEPRSTVDGFAFASQSIRMATPDTPITLSVSGQIRPSTKSPAALDSGCAVQILTGGPLPPGADCVVPAEDARIQEGALVFERPLGAREHVRAVGSDLKAGTRIIRRGEELNAQALAALAVSGSQTAKAYRPPQVLALALGNELDPPSVEAAPGQTPADNLLLVAGALLQRGVPDVTAEVCPNDLERISNRLGQGTYQCIVTTGGTGPGQRDFIRKAASDAGFHPLFDGLALTPGKSMFVAVRGATLLFALPGTPWAVFSLTQAIVLPSICWLRGRTLPTPSPILAKPMLPLQSPPLGWERLVPCTVSALGAELQAHPLLDRSREARLDMLEAQGLLIVTDTTDANELLRMIPIWENRRGHRLG